MFGRATITLGIGPISSSMCFITASRGTAVVEFDTIRWTIFTCASPNQTKKSSEETNNKNRDAQKNRSSHKVRGVSPETGRESMVEKICERGRS